MRRIGYGFGIIVALAACQESPVSVMDYTLEPTADVASESFVNTEMIDLGQAGGWSAMAHAINESGQIMGVTNIAGSGNRVFSGSAAAGLSAIGLFSDATSAVTANGGTREGRTLSETGYIVGRATAPVEGRVSTVAFFWSEPTGMLNLGILPTAPGGRLHFSVPVAVNDGGQVAGNSSVGTGASGTGHPFRWSQATGMVDLGTLPIGAVAPDRADAMDINDAGVVVGYSYVSTEAGPVVHATRWLQDNSIEDLGTLADASLGLHSQALAVNQSGQITGASFSSPSEVHAFRWDEGSGMMDLGVLSGNFSQGTLINDLGHVVGMSTGGTSFFWSPETGMLDMGQLPGGTGAIPMDLNNRDQVVGYAAVANVGFRAFLWTRDGGMQDLGMLAPSPNGHDEIRAFGINDRGDIVGTSTSDDGLFHAFLIRGATPTPESLVTELIDFVKDLGLSKGRETALLASLNPALRKIQEGDFSTAAEMMGAFIHKVNAQRGKSIDEEDAATLIAMAEQLLDLLNAD